MAELSMADILADKPTQKAPEPASDAPASDAPAPEKAEAAPHQPSNSLRKEHQKREFEAQGRDPETGQFIKKEEEKADKAEKAEKVEKPKEEAKAESKAESKVLETAKPAAPAAPQQEEMTAKEKAAFAKAADETRKRQALEARLRELEAKVSGGQPNPAEPAKTFWDDPEAALKRHEAAVQQAVVGTRLQTSEAIARSRYQDFDEKVSIFSELSQATPGLAQQMLAATDPAEFVYRTATNHKTLKEAGSIEQLKAKIEADTAVRVRAEIEAELKAKAEALQKEREALPGSLSSAQSKGQQKTAWSGPPSMADILKG